VGPCNILQVTLYRAFEGRGFIEQIASLDSTGANGDFELSTTPDLTRSVVDNEPYGYFVELTLPAPSASNKGLTLTRLLQIDSIGVKAGDNIALPRDR
jgi:hypothetical protein